MGSDLSQLTSSKLLQKAPLNVITLGQTKSDNIKQMITISDDNFPAILESFSKNSSAVFFHLYNLDKI